MALGCKEKEKTELGEGAVAMVFGQELSLEEFNKELGKFKSNFVDTATTLSDEDELKIKRRVLDSMIQRRIYLVEMDKLEIKEDQELIKKQYSQLMMQYGSKEAIEQAISGAGYTLDKFMEEMSFQTRINNLNKYIEDLELNVDEDTKKEYYQEHKETVFVKNGSVTARHILIKVENGETEALKTINSIRDEILAGLNFSDAAKKYSQGPSGENGGSLGTFGKGQMVPEFENAAFTLPVESVSEPILTQFGYHLIYVDSRVEDEIATYEEAESFITNYLKKENYLDALKVRANVIRPEWAAESSSEDK